MVALFCAKAGAGGGGVLVSGMSVCVWVDVWVCGWWVDFAGRWRCIRSMLGCEALCARDFCASRLLHCGVG